MPYIAPHIPQRVLRKRGVIVAAPFAKIKQRPEQFEIDYDHPLAKGLVFAGLGAHAGSTRYHDSSVFGNTGTMSGSAIAASWSPATALGRQSITFNGSDDYVETARKLAPTTNAVCSLSCWARTSATSDLLTIFGGYVKNEFCVLRPNVGIYMQGTTGNQVSWLGALTTGVFNHYLFTVNGTTVNVFMNGVSLGEKTLSDGFLLSNINYLGREYGPYLQFAGSLADPCGWSGRVLSDAECRPLADPSNVMLSGMIKPLQGTTKYFRGVTLSDAYTLKPPAVHVSHGNARPEEFTINYDHPLAKGLVFAGLGNQPNGAVVFDSAPWARHAVPTDCNLTTSFRRTGNYGRPTFVSDGIDGRCIGTLPATVPTADPVLTMSAWVTLLSTSDIFALGSNGHVPFFTVCSAATTDTMSDICGLLLGERLNNYYWGCFTETGSTTNSAPSAALATAGVPTHVCGVFVNGSLRQAYVNGRYVAESTTARGVAGITKVVIGGPSASLNTNSLAYGEFAISDAMIWNRNLNQNEIREIADPSNMLVSGLIQPAVPPPLPLAINDRHWVGRTNDWHSADNWSRSQGGRGGAGVPNENTNVFLD